MKIKRIIKDKTAAARRRNAIELFLRELANGCESEDIALWLHAQANKTHKPPRPSSYV